MRLYEKQPYSFEIKLCELFKKLHTYHRSLDNKTNILKNSEKQNSECLQVDGPGTPPGDDKQQSVWQTWPVT